MTQLVDIVSSRVKAEIFRPLFGLRQPEIHLRELARQSGLSLGTVQQELARLARTQLVSARRDGNRVYYRANAQHPAHSELSALVLKTDGFVSVLGQALAADEISCAFVFGSAATGGAKANSDVDLMVIGSPSLRQLVKLLSGTADRIGREINPHVFTTREWRNRIQERDHFVLSVIRNPKLFVKGTEDELGAMGQ
jgi:DNA-binding transcriptional ArsR family regulator